MLRFTLILLGLVVTTGSYPGQSAGPSLPELVIQEGHRGTVTMTQFSPRGDLLYSSSDDGTVRIWETASWQLLRTLRLQSRPSSPDRNSWRCALSPDGRSIAAPLGSSGVRIWNARSARLVATLQPPGPPPKLDRPYASVQWSPDGKLLAVVRNESIDLWDHQASRIRRVLKPAGPVSFMPDNRRLIRILQDRAEILDIASGRVLRKYRARADIYLPAALSPDATLLAAVMDDPRWAPPNFAASEAAYARPFSIIVWNLKTGRSRNFGDYGSLRNDPRSVQFVSNRELVARYSEGIHVWDPMTGKRKRSIARVREGVLYNDYRNVVTGQSPDGSRLVTSEGASIRIIDSETGRPVRTLRGRDLGWSPINQAPMAFSSDGAALAVHEPLNHDAGILSIWNLKDGKLARKIGPVRNGSQGRGIQVAFSQAQSREFPHASVALITPIGSHAWNRESGAEVSKANAVMRLLSPSGKLMAEIDWRSPSRDRPALIKHLDGLAKPMVIEPLGSGGTPIHEGASFSPDDQYLAGLGYLDPPARGHKIILWDSATGRKAKELSGSVEFGPEIRWRPNGREIAARNLLPPSDEWRSADAIYRMDPQTGALIRSWKAPSPFRGFQFSPDGRIVALFGVAPGAELVNSDDGKQVSRLQNPTNPIIAGAFSPSGRRLATIDNDGRIQLWKVTDGRLVATFHAFADTGEWLILLPDGTLESSRGAGRHLRWRVGEKLSPFSRFESQFSRPETVRTSVGQD